MPQRVMSLFSVENFCLTACRENSQGNPSLLCFRKFPVAKKFMDKRGEVSRFPSQILCLTLPKIFRRKPLSISLISGIEKVGYRGWGGGGGESRCFVESFLSHNAEKPFCAVFQKSSCREKFYG